MNDDFPPTAVPKVTVSEKKQPAAVVDYFHDKARQVTPSKLTAFGVVIDSRYGEAYELVELILFARALARRQVEVYVKSASYDSKCCVCTLELAHGVREGDAIAIAILAAATEAIGQFEWFGVIHHGGPLLQPSQPQEFEG